MEFCGKEARLAEAFVHSENNRVHSLNGTVEVTSMKHRREACAD
jgi:hypothetical protein